MASGITAGTPDSIEENDQQNAVLAWATDQIDRMVELHGMNTRDHMGDMLDWMAQFTREHFGFQQRLLKECSQHREFLMERVAAHWEFRRRLAQLCVDCMRGDATVPVRFRALCHELQQDAQAHDPVFSEIVRAVGPQLKVRRKPRRDQAATKATPLLQAPPQALGREAARA